MHYVHVVIDLLPVSSFSRSYVDTSMKKIPIFLQLICISISFLQRSYLFCEASYHDSLWESSPIHNISHSPTYPRLIRNISHEINQRSMNTSFNLIPSAINVSLSSCRG